MTSDARRASSAFALSGERGAAIESGEAEAVIGDDSLVVGPVTVSFLDVDALHTADYRIRLELWPAGELILTQLGRRFDAFVQALRTTRNQARVVGLLAHGITRPAAFSGAVIASGERRASELHVYDTHVTIVPADGDPWQVPLGAIRAIEDHRDPPAIVLQTSDGSTVLGQLGRQLDACHAAIVERRGAQLHLLEELSGQTGFSDGAGVSRRGIADFDQLLSRFTATDRTASAGAVLKAATGEPHFGFVQLLDPDTERLAGAEPLPENWAAFLLVPIGALTALEIVAGPAAATYLFRGGIEGVNRDLQLMHFRRAPLALTAEQAEVTPGNPHRLALRKLAPLQRLRSMTSARVVHNAGWDAAFLAASRN